MTSIVLTNLGAFDVEELDARTMEDVRGGVFPWIALGVSLLANLISNIPDAVEGFRAGCEC